MKFEFCLRDDERCELEKAKWIHQLPQNVTPLFHVIKQSIHQFCMKSFNLSQNVCYAIEKTLEFN